jgi:hypothetical protein
MIFQAIATEMVTRHRKKWLDSVSILKVKPTELSCELDVGCKKKEKVKGA